MSDLVRVRLDDGTEMNLSRVWAEIHDVTVLDEPTHHGDGRPRQATRKNGRPMKPKTTVAESATAKKAAKPAEDAEEASR